MRMMTSTQKIKLENGGDQPELGPLYAHVDYNPKTKDIVSMWVSTPQKFRDGENGETTIDRLLQVITRSFTETIREIQVLED